MTLALYTQVALNFSLLWVMPCIFCIIKVFQDLFTWYQIQKLNYWVKSYINNFKSSDTYYQIATPRWTFGVSVSALCLKGLFLL